MGGHLAALSGRFGSRRTGHQPDQVRRLRAALRRNRGHGSRQRHQRRKTHQPAGRTCCASGKSSKRRCLAIDLEKRQMRLGMKQLVPTGLGRIHRRAQRRRRSHGPFDGRVRRPSESRTRRRHPCHLQGHCGSTRENRGAERIESGSFVAEFHAAGALEERLRQAHPRQSRCGQGKSAVFAS